MRVLPPTHRLSTTPLLALLFCAAFPSHALSIDLVCSDHTQTTVLKNAASTVSVTLVENKDDPSSNSITISGTTPGGYSFNRNYSNREGSTRAYWSTRNIIAEYRGDSSSILDESWLLDRLAGTLSGTGRFFSENSKYQYRDLQCSKVDAPKF